jgi:hypothetical protein
MLTWLLTL